MLVIPTPFYTWVTVPNLNKSSIFVCSARKEDWKEEKKILIAETHQATFSLSVRKIIKLTIKKYQLDSNWLNWGYLISKQLTKIFSNLIQFRQLFHFLCVCVFHGRTIIMCARVIHYHNDSSNKYKQKQRGIWFVPSFFLSSCHILGYENLNFVLTSLNFCTRIGTEHEIY